MIEYSRIGEMTAVCGISQTREVLYLIKASSFFIDNIYHLEEYKCYR